MKKPTYGTSKRHLWLSSFLAWVVIILLAVGAVLGSEQAVAFGNIALPSMVALIVALLGIHRGFGSMDMKTMGYQARDQPEGETQ